MQAGTTIQVRTNPNECASAPSISAVSTDDRTETGVISSGGGLRMQDWNPVMERGLLMRPASARLFGGA